MNPLQVEQMMSSFFSKSIARTMGSLPGEWPCTLRPFRPKQVSSTEKSNGYPCASYRLQRSMNAVRAFRFMMAVCELGLCFL
jgi:hypothetical protein